MTMGRGRRGLGETCEPTNIKEGGKSTTQYLPGGGLWRSPAEGGGWRTLGGVRYPCPGVSSGIRRTPSWKEKEEQIKAQAATESQDH